MANNSETIQYPDGRVELKPDAFAEISGSPLFNRDLAPVKVSERNWTTYNYAALWISMAHCIPTYMLSSGLISAGMNWWQALITILLGRMESKADAEPPELKDLPQGVTEWMVHPGHPDAESGSSYDLARQEDLALLQKLMVRARFDEPVWGDARRVTMTEAFTQEPAPEGEPDG